MRRAPSTGIIGGEWCLFSVCFRFFPTSGSKMKSTCATSTSSSTIVQVQHPNTERYECFVTHIARVWIDRVGCQSCSWSAEQGIFSGKMNIPLSAFVPENLVSRDGFGSPVPHQPAHLHTQAESGAYLRDSSRVPRCEATVHHHSRWREMGKLG